MNIEDISDFVQQQRQNLNSNYRELMTPQEKIYSVSNPKIQQNLELSVCTK